MKYPRQAITLKKVRLPSKDGKRPHPSQDPVKRWGRLKIHTLPNYDHKPSTRLREPLPGKPDPDPQGLSFKAHEVSFETPKALCWPWLASMGRHGAARLVADVAAEGSESRSLECSVLKQRVASRYVSSSHKSSGMKLSLGLIRLPAFCLCGLLGFPNTKKKPHPLHQSFALNEASDVNTTIIVES